MLLVCHIRLRNACLLDLAGGWKLKMEAVLMREVLARLLRREDVSSHVEELCARLSANDLHVTLFSSPVNL